MDHDRKTGPLGGERYTRRHLLEAWQVFVLEQSGWELSALAPTTLCCFWEALRADRMRRVRHVMEEEPHSPVLLVSEIRGPLPTRPPLLQPGKTG